MPKQTLYQIGADLLALRDLLEEVEGDVTGQEAAIDAMLGEAGDALEEKIDGYVYVIAGFESDAADLDAEIKRLQARKRAREATAARMRERLRLFMQAVERPRIETTLHTLTVKANGGKRPVVLAPDVRAEDLDDRFVRVKREIDPDAVRAALERGENLIFAVLADRGNHLLIS